MKHWKVWGAFLAVFAAGAVVGVMGLAFVLQQQFGRPMDHADFRQKMQARLMADLVDTVRPDKAALPAIEKALNQTLDELDAHRAKERPEIEAILENGKKALFEYLTPEQRQRFEKMEKDHKGHKFGFLRLPPPPPLHMP
jgi:Spy/CpxP family protein refolding chaperone